MLAYFVVFFRNGFSPGDLVAAQKNGCMSRVFIKNKIGLTMKKHISQRIARISQTVVAKSLTQASKSMHLLRRSPSFIFQSLFVKLSM